MKCTIHVCSHSRATPSDACALHGLLVFDKKYYMFVSVGRSRNANMYGKIKKSKVKQITICFSEGGCSS